MVATEPQRRVRLLHGLGLHRGVLEAEELTGHTDAGLGPQPLHQPQALGEAGGAPLGRKAVGRIDFRIAAEPDAHDQAAVAELVDGGKRFRQVHGAAQGREEDGRAEAQTLGDRRRPRERLDGLQARGRAEDLLHHPRALVAQGLGALQEFPHAARVDRAPDEGLGNRHAERHTTVHGSLLS